MKCKKPILIKIKSKKYHDLDERYDEEEMLVPCRKCPECQRKIALEWTRRVLHEYETHEYNGYFITLTIDQAYIDDNTLTDEVSKREAQLFLKRLRKPLNYKIKYFLSAEYGEQKARAHYHAIIIGLKSQDKDQIEKAWTYGRTDIKILNYATTKYVVDYLFKEQNWELIGNRNQPFTLKSKGIGKQWFEKNIDEIIEDKCIITNGYKTSIPRYYLKKLKEMNPLLHEYILEKPKDTEPFNNKDWIDVTQYYNNIKQINQNITSLRALKK